jgi:hypothetical protein
LGAARRQVRTRVCRASAVAAPGPRPVPAEVPVVPALNFPAAVAPAAAIDLRLEAANAQERPDPRQGRGRPRANVPALRAGALLPGGLVRAPDRARHRPAIWATFWESLDRFGQTLAPVGLEEGRGTADWPMAGLVRALEISRARHFPAVEIGQVVQARGNGLAPAGDPAAAIAPVFRAKAIGQVKVIAQDAPAEVGQGRAIGPAGIALAAGTVQALAIVPVAPAAIGPAVPAARDGTIQSIVPPDGRTSTTGSLTTFTTTGPPSSIGQEAIGIARDLTG